MPTSAPEFQTKVDKTVVNMNRLDDFVNGDDSVDVEVDNAIVPSLAKLAAAAQIQIEAATASAATALAAAGPNYANTGAGLTATTNGQAFAVDNGDGTVTVYRNNSGSAVAQRTLIKDPPGTNSAALLGKAGGGSIQDFLNLAEPLFDPSTSALIAPNGSAGTPALSFINDKDTGLFRAGANVLGIAAGGAEVGRFGALGLALGGSLGNARLTIITPDAGTMNGDEVYHHAQKTNPANQTIARVTHVYGDGTGVTTDIVGDGVAHKDRQAHNPSARNDKSAGFVGHGKFRTFERSIAGNTGVEGNLGDGNDLLAEIDEKACLNIRGSDGADWGGTDTAAPLKLASFSNYNHRLYAGLHSGITKGVVGVVNSGTAFLPLQLAASKIEVNADNAVDLATASNRLKEIFCANGTINTSDERLKVWRGGATDAEMRAAKRIVADLGFYQWKESVEGRERVADGITLSTSAKGDDARFHFGARAQRVWAIMADEGLVDPIGPDGRPTGACAYAFLCFDEWPDELAPIMEEVEIEKTFLRRSTVVDPSTGQAIMRRVKGKVKEQRQARDGRGRPRFEVVTPAGTRFGLRTDQLALFLAAAQEARLAALEALAR